jgi:hypothetical protein
MDTLVYIDTHTKKRYIDHQAVFRESSVKQVSRNMLINSNLYHKCSRVISTAPTMLIKYKLL